MANFTSTQADISLLQLGSLPLVPAGSSSFPSCDSSGNSAGSNQGRDNQNFAAPTRKARLFAQWHRIDGKLVCNWEVEY